jgi:hypothetical protein
MVMEMEYLTQVTGVLVTQTQDVLKKRRRVWVLVNVALIARRRKYEKTHT